MTDSEVEFYGEELAIGLRDELSDILDSLSSHDPSFEFLNLNRFDGMLGYTLNHIDAFAEAARGNSGIKKIELDLFDFHFDYNALFDEWMKFVQTAGTFPALETFIFKQCLWDLRIVEDILQYSKIHELVVDLDLGWYGCQLKLPALDATTYGKQVCHKIKLVGFDADLFPYFIPYFLSFPNLEDLVLQPSSGSVFTQRWYNWMGLFGNPSLRKLTVEKKTLSAMEFQAITEGLSHTKSITSLHLRSVSQRGLNWQVASAASITRMLKTNTVLKEVFFDVGDGMDETFCDCLAGALLINCTLEKLMLKDYFDETKANWLAGVVLALQNHESLRSLVIEARSHGGYPFTLLLGKAFCRLLQNNQCLESLDINVCQVTDEIWRAMMSALRTNMGLKTLKLQTTKRPGTEGITFNLNLFGEELISTLKDNASLEEVDLLGIKFPESFLVSLTVKLVACSRLKRLQFGRKLQIHGEDLTLLREAVPKNYYLEELSVQVDEHLEKEFGIIWRLNAAGRRYLIEDSALKAKGCDTLTGVKEDLDCLYHHLLENPSLCDLQSIHATSPLRCKKRKCEN